MLLDGANIAAVGNANDQLHRAGAAGAAMILGDVAGHLLERGIGEGVELHLGDRAEALDGETDGDARDGAFRQRRVEDPPPKCVAQPIGDTKDTAELADILTKHQHAVVIAQGVVQRQVERLAHRHGLAHASPPGSSAAFSSSRSRLSESGMCS